MEFKALVAFFLALVFTIAIATATSPAIDINASQDLTLSAPSTVGYLRPKRQFYPGGFGGGSSFANAQASSFSGGGGFGYPGFGRSSAFANAGASSLGYGK